MRILTALFAVLLATVPVSAQHKSVVGLIPKAQKPIAMDGKLTGWDGAFVTPGHVGHPDFANRGGQFLYLAGGKVRKTSTGSKKTVDGGFTLWTGTWEMFDLPPGIYTLELVATDKTGTVITSRTEKVLHGNPMK